MTLTQKIEKLDEACYQSLGFQHFSTGWEVSSFRKGSPLEIERLHPHISGKTFEEVVNKAYQFVFGK